MNKTRERIKSVLICVLLLGMVYLTYLVWFFDSPFGNNSFAGLFVGEEENYVIYEGLGSDTDNFGIRPIGMLLQDGENNRGAIYESGAADSLYYSFRDEFAAVIGKTEGSTPVSEKEWQSALSEKCIFLDYSGNIPVESMRLWFGKESGSGNALARYFLFSLKDGYVSVYAKNSKTGETRKFRSAYPSKNLLNKMKTITVVKKADFAMERSEDEFRTIEGETLVMENRAKPSLISGRNALETFRTETTNACLAAFKLRDGTVRTYAEQDGTAVYIADMVTLKISPDGIVTYTDSRDNADDTLGIEVQYEGVSPTLAERTETARILATTIASSLPGRGGLYVEDIVAEKDKVEVVFGRTVNGIPVNMKNTSYFIRVQIENKMVKSAKLNLRYYESTSQMVDVFSERIAAAAMMGKGLSGSLRLFYCDEGDGESISPKWYSGQASDKGGNSTDGMVES